MCVEEKLKPRSTLHAAITIPSSAEDLLSTIRKYWGYLNFEIVELVVDYLHIKELKIQFEKYKNNVLEETRKLLKHCKKERITPIVPPGCKTMCMIVDVDPYSYSLHHILEAKSFLVTYLKMKVAWFAGFRPGCIILHFHILEDDMKTAVHQLKEHELELRKMHVEAIEVGDVIVYQATLNERYSSIAAVSSEIDTLAVKIRGPIFSVFTQFGSSVVDVVVQALNFLREMNEESMSSHKVKT